MPPIWSPEEEQAQSEIYRPVHLHSSGVISYTLRTPSDDAKPSPEVTRMLEELREVVRSGADASAGETPADKAGS